MCELILSTAIGFLTGGVTAAGSTAGAAAATTAGATAAGSTAGAGFGGLLQTIGLVNSIAGPIIQARQTASAYAAQEAAINRQQKEMARLNAVEDQRTRRQYASQIRQQAAQISARGLDLGSPTAVLLGQSAAEEMAFASQSVRQTGQSQQSELTAQRQLLNVRAANATRTGWVSAASNFLTAAPTIWPELLE